MSESRGVVFLIGTNNLELNSPEEISHLILTYALLFKTKFRHLTICISTLLPRIDERPLYAKVPIINDLLKKGTKKFDFHIFDLHKTFIKANLPREDYHWWKDGLHLSTKGVKKLKDSLNNSLYNLVEKLRNDVISN